MKVLHLIAGDLEEGAAKGAYLLHEHLIASGVGSMVLTNGQNTGSYRNVFSVSDGFGGRMKSLFRMKLDNAYKLFYEDKNQLKFSPGITGYDFTKTDQYKECDIVHLHWVCNGFLDVKHLHKVEKPVVWTLRDMWPMTGGCHYSLGCDRYQKTCGRCPHIGSKRRKDLSTFSQNRKSRYYPENITFVGISEWITELAVHSSLLGRYSIETISNNIDHRSFFPSGKAEAKEYFNLATHKPVLLFGAQYLNSAYKGYDIFIEILEKLYIEAEVVLFGKSNPGKIDKMNLSSRNLGFLGSEELRKAYTAADVFISTSRMEAFGKTVAESMACGTPVVCFDGTGSADIVDHKVNGYLASPFSADDVMSGIQFILNHSDYEKLSANAISKTKRCFDAGVIARKYADLYNRILEEK